MKFLSIFALLIALTTACQKEDKGETSECSCGSYLSSASDVRSYANITGQIKLTPPPRDRINSRVFVYIDERHVFSEERHRLLEREITISYEDEKDGFCGTPDLESESPKPYMDDDYESYARYSNHCDCSYGLLDKASYPPARVSAVANGDLESIDSIRLNLNFIYPDYRSVYYIGIHIDEDGDGTVSEGDYYTKEFLELSLSGSSGLKLKAEKIQSEKIVTSGNLDPGSLPAVPDGAMIKVTLFDVSVPEQPRKIADVTKNSSSDLSFALQAIPETENATWQLTAWIDTNLNGKLDRCDYVEASRQEWFTLRSMKDLLIPLAFAGGTSEECIVVNPAESDSIPLE